MNTFDFASLLRALLHRVIRIAIGAGMPYQAFAKLVREVYFDVATTYEPVKGKPNSDSRVSLLTGLPRRDVRALRERSDQPAVPQPGIERLVMDAWTSSLDLLDEHGRLLPLPRTIRQGGARSFEALVERVSTDIRARSLLDEWLRKGYVVLDEDDRVVMTSRPVGDLEGATGAGLLITEMCADLYNGFERVYQLHQPSPGFHFHVIYGHGLSEESAQLICATAQRDSGEVAQRLNRLVVERETLDARRDDARLRVSLGFMSFRADSDTDPGLLAPSRPQPA